MICSSIGLLLLMTAQTAPAPTQVLAILAERAGPEVSLRFVLSGPVDSYSATREGDDIVVRLGATATTGLGLPVPGPPIGALSLGAEPAFLLRVSVAPSWNPEILRESASLRLVLRQEPKAQAAGSAAVVLDSAPGRPTAVAETAPRAQPSPAPERTPEGASSDTADLYRRLFPSVTDPNAGGGARTELTTNENWFSNFTWLGLQARPWVSVSYVDAQTTQIEARTVTADSYWVIQPNLGIGLSPQIGQGEGRWKINYTPKFRRLVNLNLPSLTSHFFDVGIDQTISSVGAVYGTYHYSRGVLETDEVDAGREYGIGLNRVIDTSLQRFRRHGIGFGTRLDFVAETQLEINVNKTSVKYGNESKDAAVTFGPRAFFDYDTRSLNASIRRSLGEGRSLSLGFGLVDTPKQAERKQVEGRGYTYGAAIDGDIAALTTGRIMFGYRTQKNPSAGVGGQSYKDVTYGAQLVREFGEEWNLGVSADRKLYLSAFADNGFYVTDVLKGDVNGRLPLAFFLRGSGGMQWNNYKASPQLQGTSSLLRKDQLRYWSLGLSRNVARWAYLRADYTVEKRDSNLNRFDIKTRAFTVQLGVGFFGKADNQARTSW